MNSEKRSARGRGRGRWRGKKVPKVVSSDEEDCSMEETSQNPKEMSSEGVKEELELEPPKCVAGQAHGVKPERKPIPPSWNITVKEEPFSPTAEVETTPVKLAITPTSKVDESNQDNKKTIQKTGAENIQDVSIKTVTRSNPSDDIAQTIGFKRASDSKKDIEELKSNLKTKAATTSRSGIKNLNKSNFKKAEIDKLRQNVNNILRYSNATLFDVHNEKFVCAYCREKFKKPASLRAHTEEKHTPEKLLHKYMIGQPDRFYAKLDGTNIKCALCFRTFESLPVLQKFMEHLITEHSITMYTAAPYTTKIRLFSFHTDNWRCPICTTESSSFLMLNKHLHAWHMEFYCDICGSGYSSEKALASHTFLVHKTGEYKCEICEAVFQQRSQKYSHKVSAHGTKGPRKPHRCKECGERFVQFTKLKSHMLTAHEKDFQNEEQCSTCGQTFPSQKELMLHVRRVHLMERSQKCEICDRSFFDKRTLKNHTATHTGIKEFQCEVCERRFTRKSQMKDHMRIHTNDRRYACLHCERAFVQQGAWKRHVRTKHGG